MRQTWVVTWRDPYTNRKDRVKTNYLPSADAALQWFLDQKPYMKNRLSDITILAWTAGK